MSSRRQGRAVLFVLLVLLAGTAIGSTVKVGDARPVTPAIPDTGQLRARVAAHDGGFLVVWEEGIGRKSRIRAARLDTNGRSLDPSGIPVSNEPGGQFEPDVAFGHGTFLVVYSDMSHGGHRVAARRLDSDGILLDATALRLSPAGETARMPAVAATPSGFAVVWAQAANGGRDFELWGVRLDRNGHPLAEPEKLSGVQPRPAGDNLLNTGGGWGIVQNPALAVKGEEAQVVWAGTAGTAKRYSIAGLGWDLRHGGTTTPPRVLVRGEPRIFHPALCRFGDGFLVGWTDMRTRGLHGPREGNLAILDESGDPRIIPLNRQNKGGRPVFTPAVSPSGLVAFSTRGKRDKKRRFRHSPLKLRRILAEGSSPGPDIEIVPDGGWPAMATHRSGTTLLVYTRFNTRERNGMLEARVVQLQ